MPLDVPEGERADGRCDGLQQPEIGQCEEGKIERRILANDDQSGSGIKALSEGKLIRVINETKRERTNVC